ncbi:hypothetical protein ABH15_06885 [Methanoculleus taiwanensis]|uniref:Uncharacterized protein n=1 Tax=Methanoculleus taiwanensis TaxID=1550565 RepID=A0A498H0L4_9EURY|nr:hypothetical protein ABH15_06885 [Methanoculleus taiwanensis]
MQQYRQRQTAEDTRMSQVTTISQNAADLPLGTDSKIPKNGGNAHAMMDRSERANDLGCETVVMLDGDGQRERRSSHSILGAKRSQELLTSMPRSSHSLWGSQDVTDSTATEKSPKLTKPERIDGQGNCSLAVKI